MIGLDGNTKGRYVRTVDDISDPADNDGRNQRHKKKIPDYRNSENKQKLD